MSFLAGLCVLAATPSHAQSRFEETLGVPPPAETDSVGMASLSLEAEFVPDGLQLCATIENRSGKPLIVTNLFHFRNYGSQLQVRERIEGVSGLNPILGSYRTYPPKDASALSRYVTLARGGFYGECETYSQDFGARPREFYATYQSIIPRDLSSVPVSIRFMVSEGANAISTDVKLQSAACRIDPVGRTANCDTELLK